jgi:hypothetical protein
MRGPLSGRSHTSCTQRERERGRPSPSSGRQETEEGGRPAAPTGRGRAPATSGSGGVAGGSRASLGSHSLAKGGSWPPGHGSGRLRPRPLTVGEHRRWRAEENGSVSTGGPACTDGSDQLSLRRIEVAWPREVGGIGMAVPAAAASGGNWSR